MLDRNNVLCYSFEQKGASLFFMQKIVINGGGSLENKNYLSLHRVQTKKLQHNKG